MRLLAPALIGLCLSATSAPSRATILTWETFTCPIGKQKFESTAYGSRFVYGVRPDGRPLETSRGYVPPPECPKNHLIMYRDFSTEELTRLAVAIQTPEYKGMLSDESPFYRMAWLEQAINPGSSEYVWLLLQATWYVDNDPEKKERYRALFLSVAEYKPFSPDNIDSLMLRLRVINAYRETGQFDRAANALRLLPIEELSMGLPDNSDNAYQLSEAEYARWNFVTSANQLQELVLRQDRSVNPIDIIPEWMVDEECYFRHPKTAFETIFCEKPEIAQKFKDERSYFEQIRPFYDYDGPILPPPAPPKPKPRISRPR